MAGPSDAEQLMLELINEARLDPMANAARYISSYGPLTSPDRNIQNALTYFGVNGQALLTAYQALVAVGPVAWNDMLGAAAEKHSAAMIATQTQTHQATGELGLGARVQAEGYMYRSLGENVYAYADSVLYGHAGFMVDWGNGPDGMQSPAGHRINIMNATYTEVGIDITTESTSANPLGPNVITEDFGSRGKFFVLGVAYTDSDGNRFYSVGEGRADLTIQIGAATTTSTSSGGYTLESGTGAKTVTLSGGGLASAVTVQTTISTENIKLDVVNGTILQTSGSITVSGGVNEIRALGVRGLSITAGSGNQTIHGTASADTLDGGTGADRLGGGAGDDIYKVDQQGDVVFEGFNGGTDTVLASGSYYLFANIERLTLVAGSGNIFGVGNELNNLIIGNEGENLILAGAGNDEVRGGAARDALFGEDGNDTIYGEAGIDYIVAGQGNDVIDGGSEADEIYGEGGNDVLIGGAGMVTDILVGGDGNDELRGASGAGDFDYLYGNGGDDAFYVDTPADLTFEQVGEGIDTVYADIVGAGFYLYANIEKLVLLGTTPFGVGNALDNELTGNASANWLLGGQGNDVINGKAGNDVLFGESGADIFVFEKGTGTDIVGDFVHGTDVIRLVGGYTSFAQVQNSFHQVGNDGAIDLGGGDVIILQGVNLATLTASDFQFG